LALLGRNFEEFRLGLDVVVIGERGIAAHRWPGHPHHVTRRTRLARPRRGRGGALGPPREAQAMDLANDGVPRDAAELSGDLAGGEPVRPKLLQKLHPLVGPAHSVFLLRLQGLGQNPTLSTDAPSGARRCTRQEWTRNPSGARYVVLTSLKATIGSDSAASAGKPWRLATNRFSFRIDVYGTSESG